MMVLLGKFSKFFISAICSPSKSVNVNKLYCSHRAVEHTLDDEFCVNYLEGHREGIML